MLLQNCGQGSIKDESTRKGHTVNLPPQAKPTKEAAKVTPATFPIRMNYPDFSYKDELL